MIFPTLKNKKYGYLNLNSEAKIWAENRKGVSLVDPKTCERMVHDVHVKYSIDFSYGGWMEDRSFLWHGSYLDASQSYIHLGIDLNVSAGTPVALDFDAVVVRVDDDFPEEGGWGPRVIVKYSKAGVYVV
jgi:murein DD-endopeptidase MepM/ murein hydrolase activator NlpD